MVYVWSVVAPRVALTGLLTVNCTVSLGSSMVSFTTVSVMFSAVSPGVKVNVPEARV